ncbi:MAG: ABC transporter permease, partial [Clostridiales bacterium]
ILVYIYLTRSKQGYETTVVGQSVNTARYAGMNVSKVLIRTMLFAGALAGIVGFMQVSGADYTLHESTAGGVGFTAITVAWLSQLNPVIMVVVAMVIAILEKGASRIKTTFNIPASASDVLIGIILFFMLGCEFFINYRLVFRSKKGALNHG